MRSSPRSTSLLAILIIGWALPAPAQRQPDPYTGFVAQSKPRSPQEELKSFHLPPGFQIELVASEPDIIKPINMNFDASGRLWVTQSVEYPFPAPPGRRGRDTIRILREGKVITYADGLNIPIGVLPLSHGALVYSIPNVFRLIDKDGSHAIDRQVILSKFGFGDTHGMTGSFTWGFDGWVYACHGFSNTSTVKAGDGSSVTMNSGNAYRFRPDGNHIEQFTHGQVNPFGLCFDPLGNLYSADCHTRPVMMLLRGAYYESFGKPHDGLGYAPEMCDHDHGSTAICGIVYYAADQFPLEYRDRVYMGNVVTNRINQDTLERHGSTYKAIEQPDFLVSDDPWFRPVDLKLGPDGAIYVADFYNRIIGHYEVPLTHPGRDHERGRIWRISYKGAENGVGTRKAQDSQPRFPLSTAGIPALVSAMADPNLVIRMLAANQLVERRGEEVLKRVLAVVSAPLISLQRVHGLWVLERLGALADSTLAGAARDAERTVRVHAMRILAERTQLTGAQERLLLAGLEDSDPLVARCAADAMGTHPAPGHIAALLALRHKLATDDTHLLYGVRVALRNQLLSAQSWRKLELGQLSEVDRRAVADVATGVPSAQAAGFLMSHLHGVSETPMNLVRFVHHIARYGSPDALGGLSAFLRGRGAAGLKQQAVLLRAMQQGLQERGGKLDQPAEAWARDLAGKLLQSDKEDENVLGAELTGSLHIVDLEPILAQVAASRVKTEALRRAAINALMAVNAQSSLGLLAAILDDAAEPFELRQHVARVLAGKNRPEAYEVLLRVLTLAPAPLQASIADSLSTTAQGTKQLLDAVAVGKASARLLQEWGVHIRLSKDPQFAGRLAKLTEGLPPADERLRDIIQKRRQGFTIRVGDAGQGVKVFEKNCSCCHQIAGKGSKIGPQLDGVGARGLDRLLEDIIDPNRNVDQAFRATSLVLRNGQALSGLILREEGEVLVLADAQGKETRIPKNAIEERTVSQLSPMPANLVDQIPETDLYHLLAYLLAQGPKKLIH
jgi:putative heme-binding domain-containing protein